MFYVPGYPSLRLRFHGELRNGRVVKHKKKKKKVEERKLCIFS